MAMTDRSATDEDLKKLAAVFVILGPRPTSPPKPSGATTPVRRPKGKS